MDRLSYFNLLLDDIFNVGIILLLGIYKPCAETQFRH